MSPRESPTLSMRLPIFKPVEPLLRMLAVSLILAGCEEAVIGQSAMLKTSLAQSLVGPFEHTTYAIASGDLDGDGLADLVVYDKVGASSMSTVDDLGHLTSLRYTSPPARVRIYYGRGETFGELVTDEDADATLTLRPGEYAGQVMVRDLDRDGDGDLMLVAPMSHTDDPNPGSIYLAMGGARHVGKLPLASVAASAPVHLHAWNDLQAFPFADLDATPGLELVSRIGNESVEIRHADDGSLVARLQPRAGEELQPLAALDVDADGANDVVCSYFFAEENAGMGIFYGPFRGTRMLGEEGTATLSGDGSLYSGVVGNFVGDAHDDLLMLSTEGLLVLPGGTRFANGRTSDVLEPVAEGSVDIFGDWGPWIGKGADVDGDGFHEILLSQGQDLRLLTVEGRVLSQLELAYADGSAVGTFYGGDLGDVNGDGQLDLVLGTASAEGAPTVVHVVYGFGH